MIIKEFGENSGVVFEKTKYKPDIFTPISEQDRIYQAKVNVELQALAGPESAIDLSYIEEIVASKREIE
jgi:hypothetical protein